MEENNFETIINTWRRLSGEQVTEPTYASMSGESPNFPESSQQKKEEEANLVTTSESKHSAAVGPSNSSVNIPEPGAATAEKKEDNTKDTEGKGDGKDSNDEKECFVKRDRESSKDGDSSNESDDKDYLNNDDNKHEEKQEKDNKSDKSKKHKDSDKVDSVFLRPAPGHRARSTRSSAQEEDGCGIKCLYYTLQCCDCALM